MKSSGARDDVDPRADSGLTQQPVTQPNGESATPAAVQELARVDALRLLAAQQFGRLAVSRPDDGPLVVPVNFLLVDDTILVRTGVGTKLGLVREAMVSFQVDEIDPVHRSGWSVLVTGRAYDATDWLIDRHELTAWAGGSKDHWIRIVIAEVSGRVLPPPTWPVGPSRGYL